MLSNYEKLRALLRELFQMDQADLDFGLYRIMNAKRDEIERFLEHDLLPQVKAELARHVSVDSGAKKSELDEVIANAKKLGVDPDKVPRVLELRDALKQGADLSALENEIFSHVYTFFRRYYDEGDFLSLRRYKEGVYAIPYEGEEVKLHWANHDQYYIKTTEFLRNYAFKVRDGRRVHFRVVEADTEKDNKKPASGKERRFVLSEDAPVQEVNGELVLHFHFKPDSRRQIELNAVAASAVLSNPSVMGWVAALSEVRPTTKNPERTLLAQHVEGFTARNTFDYFIHKDLGGFLRRELDFFIKNEIMHLDDVEEADAARCDVYLSKIKCLRAIARKIISFLEQIETFQKRLWLKSKFVVDTRYCMTIDMVPATLHGEVCANEAQWREWRELLGLPEDQERRPEFLKANPSLVIDTGHFDPSFKTKLVASIDSLDERLNGVCFHSENFQALRLMQARYRGRVKCVYIDPPYNTSASAILYKNDYKHSSWATLMRDRVALLRHTLRQDGAIFVSIDKHERTILEHVLDLTFGTDNHIEELIWSMNTNNSQAPNYSTNHEYVLVYAKDRATAEADTQMFREPKPGFDAVMELVERLNPTYPPLVFVEEELKKLYDQHKMQFREEIEAQGLDWDSEKGNDPWKGLYNYSHAEYRDSSGGFVEEHQAQERRAHIWIWQEDNTSMPASKQSPSTRDPQHPNYRFYKPTHPRTGKPCPHPKSGWKFAYDDDKASPDKQSFVALDRDHRIAWGQDENKVPRIKRMLHEVDTNIGKSVFTDYSDGEKQTSALFGRSGMFLAPKHADFVSRFIMHSTVKDSIVLDCFGGSGSTAHAVISTNRLDQGSRKYVTVEMGDHFETIIIPRLKKVAYSAEWREGKPLAPNSGKPHAFKIVRLEGYEDTLNNLQLLRSGVQDDLLGRESRFREDYLLGYMLDVETRTSASLLNVEKFNAPFAYKLKVSTGTVGESNDVTVDLVETFNFLLGLRVKHMDDIRKVRVVEGTNPEGERVLILWRNVAEVPNDKLDEWFNAQGYNTRDQEYDLIYVNGDNHLENLRRADQTWKVRLIEEDFHKLMWQCDDV